MAGLIVKSPYIKCGGGNAGGYMKYIATRENVQKLADDRPPTRRQEQLIKKLVTDIPNTKTLPEYADYAAAPTKAHASGFINTALESNWDSVAQSEVYMRYIATRPRAEQLSSHGLFGDEDHVDLASAMAQLESYSGNIWTHIISLHREDAVRLGYDNAAAWRDIIRAHRNDIATAMKIPPNDFRWYAAFHDEGVHPHVHMMAWSADPKQGYLSKDGIRQIKSVLTNNIFQQEMHHTYEQKSDSRDVLVQASRKMLSTLARQMRQGICDPPEMERELLKLSRQLETVTGKKTYGYLPRSAKRQVDNIVDLLSDLPQVQACYTHWLELRQQVQSYYSDRPPIQRVPLSQQKEFRSIKNAVIHEAELIRQQAVTLEEPYLSQMEESDADLELSSYGSALFDMMQDSSLPLEDRDSAVQDMKEEAERGEAGAQLVLGRLYRDGGLVIPDTELAQNYFRQAAEQGSAAAQYALGKLYLDDPEVRDPAKGIAWLERSAQKGNHYAAYRLGKEYLRGKYVAQDIPKAVSHLNSAADLGNQFAQYLLGKLYLAGKYVPQDQEQAVYRFAQSAAQGNEYAQYFVERQHQSQSPSVMLAAARLLYHMSGIFQQSAAPASGQTVTPIDRKRQLEMRERRMAMGHAEDDHEIYVDQGIPMGYSSM